MSNPNWTEEQLDAVTARNCSLLVAAAAGTGKTAVLVERIIRRITDSQDPVDIDKLLVVTFTKAAAAEMRERVNRAIVKELNKFPESRHLNRQLTLLNRASITTLHSFCLDIVKQYFYCLDLDPSFRVADDTEAALLRLETLEELFEEHYTSGLDDFLNLVDSYGGDRNDNNLQEMILTLYEFAVSNPWPEEWLNGMAQNYTCREEVPLSRTAWGRTLTRWLEIQLQGCRMKLERAAKLASSPDGPAVYLDNLGSDMSLVDDLLSANDIGWEELYNIISLAKFNKLKPCRDKFADDSLLKSVKKMRDEVKKTVNNIKSEFFFRPPEQLTADLNRVAPFVETLAQLVTEFRARYAKAKAARALVDFADLEHFCLQILTDKSSSSDMIVPSEIALGLRKQIVEVLVDEYQDINAVQESVLELVSRARPETPNLFMVGDVKQSIYRFRLAEPALFMEKYLSYSRERNAPDRGIDLTRNFRCRQEVVDAVNFIFRQLMTAGAGEISYDQKAELVCGAHYPPTDSKIITTAGPAELYLIEKKPHNTNKGLTDNGLIDSSWTDDDTADDDSADLDAIQREARLTAGRIKEMVNGNSVQPGPEFFVYDRQDANYRPVRYRDIVVLLRAARNTADTFLEEFRLAGIPAYADLGTGYFEAIEIETMMSLLKIIDNPRQDIPLAAVLRSPVVGLNAEQLAAVRLRDTLGQLYDAVQKSARLGENGVDLQLQGFLNRLEEWRTLAHQGPLAQLIWLLYNETRYYAYVGGMPAGAQRQANLRALHDRARQYEATSFRGLFRFLRFINHLRETGNDLGSARSLGENEDVVRVISIHKSKGLEFPVVIAAGLGKQFNTADFRKKALIHKELGVGLPVVDHDLCLSYPSIAQAAVKKRLQMESLAEEMRILYVALTRTKEKLILVGSVNNIKNAAARWCENVGVEGWPLPDPDLSAARCFLDWICPAVARHPDGAVLRNLSSCGISPVEPFSSDPSRWQVYFPEASWISPHFVAETPRKSTSAFRQNREAPDPGMTGPEAVLIESVRRLEQVNSAGKHKLSLNACLSWEYPFRKVAGKPVKASVTEVKRRFAGESGGDETYPLWTAGKTSPLKRPVFLQQASSSLSAAERGSALHLVMQHIDLTGGLNEAGIRAKLEAMVADEFLTKEQAGAVNLQWILKFFQSPLGLRIANAVDVKREIPFTMLVPAHKVYDDLDSSDREQLLIQGVIDCLFDEGDGYVIVDYKTDTARLGQVEETIRKYGGQLNLYAAAIETILRLPVKEKYLYMFATGQEIKCV
ncbi:MAG: helicase-exonuclease AddAB subunit AddA [Firmicutes bacterium HGW-Firmicutes-8]|nr:MAG: helicase-exonuclease AddAB subunit AddA [Firmicutes bacterium HGW-Firmicutes-8]